MLIKTFKDSIGIENTGNFNSRDLSLTNTLFPIPQTDFRQSLEAFPNNGANLGFDPRESLFTNPLDSPTSPQDNRSAPIGQRDPNLEKTVFDISQNASDVINETFTSTQANITSSRTLTIDEALDAAEVFLGPGYTEIGRGRGVYRSADGRRQFRIDDGSIGGKHPPNVPHAHFEIIPPGGGKPTINNHVPIVP